MAFNDAFLVVTNVRIENIFVENVNMKCINLHGLQKLLETEIQQDMLVVFRKRESWRLNKRECQNCSVQLTEESFLWSDSLGKYSAELSQVNFETAKKEEEEEEEEEELISFVKIFFMQTVSSRDALQQNLVLVFPKQQ
ncbi:hypothetical protein T4B_5352 [Trichinella pseudospiralis]|uniref:Uncharacterized protein n=1 Tax=Trichinella pseudospiralis TaxID=6337 RepID=A0A0V1IJU9_TRIPS|nr:hypothetical protein T4B_5352 [Trichinella pseudospiralis]